MSLKISSNAATAMPAANTSAKDVKGADFAAMLAEAKNAKPDASDVPAADALPARPAATDKNNSKPVDKNADTNDADKEAAKADSKSADAAATAQTDKTGKTDKTDKSEDKDAAKAADKSDDKSGDKSDATAQANAAVQPQPQPAAPQPQPVTLAMAVPTTGDSQTDTDADTDGADAAVTGPQAAGATADAKPAAPGKPQLQAPSAAATNPDSDVETTDAADTQDAAPAKPNVVAQALSQAKSATKPAGKDAAAAKPDADAKADASSAPQPQQSQAPAQPQPATRADAAIAPATTAAAPSAAAPATTVSVDVAPAQHMPDINSLAVEISAKSQSGAKQFEIRLDPPELGRVDVRLSIDATGKAQAHLSADQPQTLELLQKDSGSLTQALRDAGLDVSQNGLNFSLRGQNQQSGEGGRSGAQRGASLNLQATKTIDAVQSGAAFTNYGGANARLDIHV